MSPHNRNATWQQQRNIPQPRFGGCPGRPDLLRLRARPRHVQLSETSGGIRAKQCWIELRLLLFVLGFAFLSYLYGVASSRFSLFPYEIVREAWIAGKALREAIAAGIR